MAGGQAFRVCLKGVAVAVTVGGESRSCSRSQSRSQSRPELKFQTAGAQLNVLKAARSALFD